MPATPPVPADEPARLAALRRYAILDTPPEQDFDDLALLASQICHTPIALVTLVDENRQWFKARVGLDGSETDRAISFCAHAVAAPEPGLFVIPDASRDPRFQGYPSVTGAPEIRFYAGAPLVTDDGHAVGTLCVIDREPRVLTPGQRNALEALGRQTVAQLELRRRLRERDDEAFMRVAAEQVIRDSEARFRRLSDAASDAIALVDAVGRLVEVNRAFAEAFGIGPDSAPGLLAGDLVAPGDAHILAAVLADERDRPPARLRGRRRDGALFPLELRAKDLSAGDHNRQRVLLMRDLSDQQALDVMKNEFVSVVSHELRTPLTSIRGSLGLVEGGAAGAIPDKARSLIEIARTNADRLIRLVNDILDLEKMEAGEFELRIATLDPRALLEHTLASLQGVSEQHGIVLRAEVETQLRFAADRDRIIQVLTNLVSNAIKFSPAAGTVTVRCAPSARSDFLRFSVTDQGQGIRPDQADRLFRKFQQLDGSDNRVQGGTGLGLAISRTIVEQHGGTIGVQSVRGDGATFWFELPTVSRPANIPDERFDAPTVLVIEDDENLAGILSLLMESEGYRVLHAATLAAADVAVKSSSPTAILLDLELPDGNGLEWLESARKRGIALDAPVVVLSGRKPDGTLPHPQLLDWLSKPFDEAHLMRALRLAARRPGTARVLLVEDDDSTRTVLATRLQSLGLVVIEAADGAEALRRVHDARPDLIVLDVTMPRMDGFELVDILRRESARATPLIVFTGRDLSAAERRALTLGMTRHLVKARASDDEFVDAVRDMLHGLHAPLTATAT